MRNSLRFTIIAATMGIGGVFTAATAQAATPEPEELAQQLQPIEQFQQLQQDVQHQFDQGISDIQTSIDSAVDSAIADAHETVADGINQGLAQAQDVVSAQVSEFTEQAPSTPSTPAEVTPTAPVTQRAESHPVPDPQANGRDYEWFHGPISAVLAGKAPNEGPVLHRVFGSLHDADPIPEASVSAQAQGTSLYGPGTPIYVNDTSLCTIAAVGTDTQGRNVGLTAGHCGNVGDTVASADSWQLGATGTFAAKNPELDYAVIEFDSNAQLTDTYNAATVTGIGDAPRFGGNQCKQGLASAWTCGPVWATGNEVTISQVCAMPGDSGGPVIVDGKLVGMVRGGALPYEMLACRTPLQGMAYMPTVTTNASAVMNDLNANPQRIGAGFTPVAAAPAQKAAI